MKNCVVTPSHFIKSASPKCLITNYELRIEILRRFAPQNDNTDGRRQIADGRFWVVGNRRPLQCHSERSEESQILNYVLQIYNPSASFLGTSLYTREAGLHFPQAYPV